MPSARTTTTTEATRRLVHGVWGMHRRMATLLGTGLPEACGLDLDDFVLLETIALTDLAPGEVAQALRLPAHAVSRGLGRLEGAGLVARRIDPEDARRRVVALTDAGRAALARAHAHLERALGPWLTELPPDRTLLALDALTRLATGRDAAPDGTTASAAPAATDRAR
ncbi:MAG: MarR family winged helix-turn-helix transcriptional regulator [Trueperaceae bacterium]|nr:MarR family winged helix-turn-helix transcriptional regulator [Trueperaceae bacterium]